MDMFKFKYAAVCSVGLSVMDAVGPHARLPRRKFGIQIPRDAPPAIPTPIANPILPRLVHDLGRAGDQILDDGPHATALSRQRSSHTIPRQAAIPTSSKYSDSVPTLAILAGFWVIRGNHSHALNQIVLALAPTDARLAI